MFEISETTVPRHFKRRPVEVAAAQWFKNGDHPQDESALVERLGDRPDVLTEGKVVRYFRHPAVTGDKVCPMCEHTMHRHGWLDAGGDGFTVCPGDWVVTDDQGQRFPVKPGDFADLYEPSFEVPASARREGQRPGAERLEGARHLAEYWINASRKGIKGEDIFIAGQASANVWKNAAYAFAEELAQQHEAKVPVPR